MKTKIIKIIATLIATLSLVFTPTIAFADDACTDICNCNVPQSVKDAAGCTPTGSTNDFADAIVGILNGIIAALGIVAVIVIIIGGVGYITSTGDAGKVKKAKDTILYACIGLIICVLAFAIVNFVIANVIGKA